MVGIRLTSNVHVRGKRSLETVSVPATICCQCTHRCPANASVVNDSKNNFNTFLEKTSRRNARRDLIPSPRRQRAGSVLLLGHSPDRRELERLYALAC